MNRGPASLEAEISAGLPDRFSDVRIASRPSPYSTSAPIYDVTVCDAGVRRRLLAKNLAWDALLPEAQRTKPRFVHEPRREPGVYERVLAHEWGTPCCYGSTDDAESGSSWLLLEKVRGRELFQVGERRDWERTARWLDRFHRRGRQLLGADLSAVPLVVRDEAFYWRWLRRALRFCTDERMGDVATHYALVVRRLLDQPQTFVHGELYASNVLVTEDRVCPIDWEMAGFGPLLLDLAALTSGRGWSDADRLALVHAYCRYPPGPELLLDLEACRAALAVQWLGWAPEWQPPDERAQDWIAEATRASRTIADAP